MPRPKPRRTLLAVATLAALAATPGPAHAVAPGTASARRALAATLAGDAHGARTRALPAGFRRHCPDPMAGTAPGRLAARDTDAGRLLARWTARARGWVTGRGSLALYLAVGLSGLRDLASRIANA